jgi:hypothetical protein
VPAAFYVACLLVLFEVPVLLVFVDLIDILLGLCFQSRVIDNTEPLQIPLFITELKIYHI